MRCVVKHARVEELIDSSTEEVDHHALILRQAFNVYTKRLLVRYLLLWPLSCEMETNGIKVSEQYKVIEISHGCSSAGQMATYEYIDFYFV